MIEGLRTDSLYFFGTGLRVSQVLGFASCLAAIGLLVWNLALSPRKGRRELLVDRVRRMEQEAQVETTAPEAVEDAAETAAVDETPIGSGDLEKPEQNGP